MLSLLSSRSVISRSEWVPFVALMVLMVVTRSVHSFSFVLSDASWAIFFMGGYFFMAALPLFFVFYLLSVAIDVSVLSWSAVSAVCLSPGYLALIPAYASLWFSGRLFARYLPSTFDVAKLLLAVLIMMAGISACFVISNAGYYAGAYLDQLTVLEYIQRVAVYYPLYVVTSVAYIAAILGVHFVWQMASAKLRVSQ